MSRTLFEDPTYAYVALVFAELALAAVWYERRSRAWAAMLPVPLALAALIVLADRLVVTDRESIEAIAKDIAQAVSDRDFERIGDYLDEEFVARPAWVSASKATAAEAVESQANSFGITKVGLHGMRVDVAGDGARMHVTTVIHYGRNGLQRTALIWDVVWIRRGGWKVLEVTKVEQGFEL